GRATLARQMLLKREATTVVRAVERLAGMQAQQPKPPFVGLWSRVEGFQREALGRALLGREVVRATLMRGTIHLMTTAHFLPGPPQRPPAGAQPRDARGPAPAPHRARHRRSGGGGARLLRGRAAPLRGAARPPPREDARRRRAGHGLRRADAPAAGAGADGD